MSKRLIYALSLLFCLSAWASAAKPGTPDLQANFETRYKTFLTVSSQSKLPFDELTHSAWKAVQADNSLNMVFQKPDVFYQGKTYVFTLYQSTEGTYYLNAKGGFWGMEELIYGPIALEMLQ